ncbi:DUF6493 family protein [Nonomuraea typhae]|uniref:DUF6493 family protein n=1 Tax=Nonomuraea typhae TaxID=2603600 RepID=A0ABW7YQB5_9ACTN
MIENTGDPAAHEMLGRIESGSVASLVAALNDLGDDDRRALARRLPAHLAERARAGFDGGRVATRYRMAGAACLGGAQQVASWLHRRELARAETEGDTGHVMAVLARRPETWRRDLAVRLVRRLRPGTGPLWWRVQARGNWELAAALVIETGAEPPENDAFVSGWVARLAYQQRMRHGAPVVGDDRLLDHMLPRLFQAQGVAEMLESNRLWSDGHTIVGELAALSATGRVPRQALIDGCVSRFLTGVAASEAGPFVALWRELAPRVAELPVADLVRVLPSASSPVVQLAVEELQRAESEGALGDELFAEAAEALAYRPEKKYMTAAVKWIAAAPPARGGLAVGALAAVLLVDTPSLRERAVRAAVKLAPHACAPDRDAIREAAARLPADLRVRLAAGFGAVEEPVEEPGAAPTLTARPLPALDPPIASVAELAAELDRPLWPESPARFERILAALVTLTCQDRDAVVAGLQPWWRSNWQHPFDAGAYASWYGEDIRFLLERCVLAVVSPADSRALTSACAGYHRADTDPAPQRFVRRRFLEVVSLLERGETIPVLLATPTSATGHVDAATLVARMELLGETEPPAHDFAQALLRLPRRIDPDAAARSEQLPSQTDQLPSQTGQLPSQTGQLPSQTGQLPSQTGQLPSQTGQLASQAGLLLARVEQLPSRAGRLLASVLRAGGLPDPVVTWAMETFARPEYYHESQEEAHARLTPPDGVPEQVAALWTLAPKPGYPAYSRDMVWWPPVMPSHREAVAAHVLECLPWFMTGSDGQVQAVAALAHGDGPAGIATASAIVIGMGHERAAERAEAADAIITLAARGELPGADLGVAVARIVRGGQVKLNRITGVLDEVTAAGAHAEVWAALARALPLLLPGPGEKARAGLGELLKVAVRAAAQAGARGELPGLAELAARKGSSLVVHEARRLSAVISA